MDEFVPRHEYMECIGAFPDMTPQTEPTEPEEVSEDA